MTTKFMQNYQVYLTPLSPIHIGCGEDFEPTNYVIDEGVLYHFEPSKLYLSKEQKTELLNLSQRCDLLAIQRFFKKNAKQATEFSHYIASVGAGVAEEWEMRIGKVAQRESNSNKVISNLAIERNAYLAGINEPYIPGSSFKGALATVLLDNEHRKRGNPDTKEKHKDLLKKYLGEFKDSKLRLVKFSDFMPTQPIQSKVYYSLNFKKEMSEKGILGKGVPLRRECIVAGQFHAFKSELSLWKEAPLTIKDYFKRLTEYHLPIFEKECERLVTYRLISPVWVNGVKTLLANNNVALVRLGKNGADSKIYQAKGMAKIKIMTGKGRENKYLDRSTTVWLAGNNKSQQSELYPFGWALLELNDGQENAPLKQWCEQQSANHTFDKVTFFAQQAEIKQQKQQAYEAELAKQHEQKKQRLAEEQALQRQLAEREKALNLVNKNQRLVLEMLNTLADIRQPLQGSNRPPEFIQFETLCETAQTWNEEDKAFLIEKITLNAVNNKITLSKKSFDKFKKYGLKKS
ncbi:type III-A CRISPR-associated RAMP protein Csm5 [Gallibacterium melopsittaci]|uniref:CRISPR system Cms protein Csm5 n=1 Tax=Gallibacterium melopsittaci TaxID=516063 RepID=A0ABV6HV68_9PAST